MILGILTKIVISQFEAYKRRAANANALHDMRNILSAEEHYFADNNLYTDDVTNLTTVEVSDKVVVGLGVNSGDPTRFYISSYHEAGNITYCYAIGIGSNPGKIQEFDGINNTSNCP